MELSAIKKTGLFLYLLAIASNIFPSIQHIKNHISFIEKNKKLLCVEFCNGSLAKEHFSKLIRKYFTSHDAAMAFSSFIDNDSSLLFEFINQLERIEFEDNFSIAEKKKLTYDAVLCICMLYKTLASFCVCQKIGTRVSFFEIIYFFMQFSKLPLEDLFDILELCQKEFSEIINPYISESEYGQQKESINTLYAFGKLILKKPWIAPIATLAIYFIWKKWSSKKINSAVI